VALSAFEILEIEKAVAAKAEAQVEAASV